MKYFLKPDGHGEMSGAPYYKVIKRGILWDSTYATCLTQTEAELLCDLQNKINPFSDGAHTQSTINNLARIRDLERSLAEATAQLAVNHARAEEIIKAREAKLGRVSLALRDAISTYDDSREITLVSAERQEAWRDALNS